ncbi:hypothetical protein ACIHDR_24045 [Nocardia sp. NPDC052278]|uniref:hypothetical protein n=1 Tax=unclassified Nocardia TaxID=2637762 RepID=UPI0036CF6447
MSIEVEPIPPEEMLGESDWADEDLLTVAEASERLAMEVRYARVRAKKAAEVLSSDPNRADAAELRGVVDYENQRADELMAAAERIRAAQAVAPGPS